MKSFARVFAVEGNSAVVASEFSFSNGYWVFGIFPPVDLETKS